MANFDKTASQQYVDDGFIPKAPGDAGKVAVLTAAGNVAPGVANDSIMPRVPNHQDEVPVLAQDGSLIGSGRIMTDLMLKVSGAQADRIATMTAGGQVINSGKQLSDLLARVNPYTPGNLPVIVAPGQLEDSGISINPTVPWLSKVSPVVAGNIAIWTSTGELADATVAITDVQQAVSDITGLINGTTPIAGVVRSINTTIVPDNVGNVVIDYATPASVVAAQTAAENTSKSYTDNQVATERAAREAADTTLSTTIADHIRNINNPHRTDLTLAANEQAAYPTVLNGSSIYENAMAPLNKYLTYAEILAQLSTTGTYMGQFKYGADDVATMQSILQQAMYPVMNGDKCAVGVGTRATIELYQFDSGTGGWAQIATPPVWDPVANPTRPVNTVYDGDIYDILYWYGTFYGQTHTGDTSAQIKCPLGGASNFEFDVFLTNQIGNGTVSDAKIGPRQVNDNAASNTLANGAALLTTWLQRYHDNLKWLFNNVTTVNTSLATLTQNLADEAIARENKDTDLEDKLSKLGGTYRGAYQATADLPGDTRTLPGAKVGDWALLKNDANGLPALMRISAVALSGAITWVSDYAWPVPEYSVLDLTSSIDSTQVNSGNIKLIRYGNERILVIQRIRVSGQATNYNNKIWSGAIPAADRPSYIIERAGACREGTGALPNPGDLYNWATAFEVYPNGDLWIGRVVSDLENRYSAEIRWFVNQSPLF